MPALVAVRGSPPRNDGASLRLQNAALRGADGVNEMREQTASGRHITGFHIFGEVAKLLMRLTATPLCFLYGDQRLRQALFFSGHRSRAGRNCIRPCRLRFHLKHAVGAGENNRPRE